MVPETIYKLKMSVLLVMKACSATQMASRNLLVIALQDTIALKDQGAVTVKLFMR